MNGIRRGSDVFLAEDIRGNLEAILMTNELAVASVGGNDALTDAYRRGFMAAVYAVARAHGIVINQRMIVQR